MDPASLPDIALPPIPRTSEDQRLSSQPSFMVRRIKLTGNTVFGTQVLHQITSRYEGRKISTEELLALRNELTLYYIDHGYINSGAVIPDQEPREGVIEIAIIEGTLSDVRISGNTRLKSAYIRDRIDLVPNLPLNINDLKESIQLLDQNPLIQRISAELMPGLQRGESVLKVEVSESRPYDFGFSVSNWRSPGVGEIRGELQGSHSNLTGRGDALSLQYGVTEGLNDFAVDYAVPINARDLRFGIFLSQSQSEVIEEPFDAIDITSETESYGLRLEYPFRRTLNGHFLASITLERRHSESLLLGEPHPFSPGSENGESTVTVFRLGQEWLSRRANAVLAARSRFSFGIDAFNATINEGDLPDGKFVAWLGQFQWIRRLPKHDIQFVVRSDLQLSADPLLSLEKFGIGGATSVRGYRENLLVRDNGWVSSVETRIPITKLWLGSEQGPAIPRLALFYDFGWGENIEVATPDPKNISSAGVGLRWSPSRHLHTQLYWGTPLRNIDTVENDALQDKGVHFMLNYDF